MQSDLVGLFNNHWSDGFGLPRLNSLTKYPSIPTYHKLGENGLLTEERNVVLTGPTVNTEKIDGINIRIIFRGGDYVIGSREELLFARGDRLYNAKDGIVLFLVNKVMPELELMRPLHSDYITVYGELYGGNLPKAGNYTNTKSFGFRIFDVVNLSKSIIRAKDIAVKDLSMWREDPENGPLFTTAYRNIETGEYNHALYRSDITKKIDNVLDVPDKYAAPRLLGMPLPETIKDTYDFLCALITKTRCAIDDPPGLPEGVICRDAENKHRVKLKLRDYERTLGIKRK